MSRPGILIRQVTKAEAGTIEDIARKPDIDQGSLIVAIM